MTFYRIWTSEQTKVTDIVADFRNYYDVGRGLNLIRGDILILSNYYYYHHHHHMPLQPKAGPGLPCWGLVVVITFLRGWIVSPEPNPQPGGPVPVHYGATVLEEP
jgi:hypothetical protein